jgi:hypothetical protein
MGDVPLIHLSAATTSSLVKDEVGYLHDDLGQLNVLVRIVGLHVIKLTTSTPTAVGRDVAAVSGLEQFLSVPFPAFLATGLALFLRFVRALSVRAIT